MGAMPSTEQMGHRVDLPEQIREKMEASFGADFSGVKLYESQTVADAGAEAMTMGSNVAFAPGQLDLASTSGQALLGHELSHVVSQARGESAGQGFLADAGLEAQADRQGALAAQGESVYTGPVTPLSASAVPASAAGPMQAEKDITKAQKQAATDNGSIPSVFHPFQRAEAKRYYLERWNRREPARNALEQEAQNGAVSKADARRIVNAAYERNHIDWRSFNRTIGADSDNRPGPYKTYLEDKLTHAADEAEQDMLIQLFTSENRRSVREYIGDDLRQLTNNMRRFSGQFASGDFGTQADAYAASGADAKHLNSFFAMNLRDILSEEELDAFRTAKDNFEYDRNYVAQDLRDASGDPAGAGYRTKQERERREQYWAARRNGN